MSSHLPHRIGFPIVISSPSGGGKTTIAKSLLQMMDSLSRSVSCTTRRPRPGEQDGIDYFFVSDEDFLKKKEEGEFLESAKVHEFFYGTPVGPLKQKFSRGEDVLLVIDPQGAVNVRKIYPQGVFIFIVPPSWTELESRLRNRGTDEEKSIQIRMKDAQTELTYLPHYDYLVLNKTVDQAVSDVAGIIRSERFKVNRLNKEAIEILKGSK